MDSVFIFVIPIIIISIILHEIAHGWAALFLGDRTALNAGRLTLNPLSHLDPVGSVLLPIVTATTGFIFGYAKPVPYNPSNLREVRLAGRDYAEALVALAGPMTNIILAVLFALIYHGISVLGISVEQNVQNGIALAVVLNLFLAFLNLIPVPPLDGSKILFTFLSYRSRRLMEKYSLVLIGLVIALIIFTPILQTLTFEAATLLLG